MRRLAVTRRTPGLRSAAPVAVALAFAAVAPAGHATALASEPFAAPATASWVPVASMHVGRDRFAAALGGDGRIYAIGGVDRRGAVLRSVEAYDPAHDGWRRAAALPTPRFAFAAAAGRDGRIYVIGGFDPASFRPLGRVDAYDPATDSWQRVASLPTPRGSLAATLGADGRIYAIGGCCPGGTIDAPGRTEAYDPGTNRWTRLPDLPGFVRDLAAATGGDGRVYAIGGFEQVTGQELASTLVYDASSRRWQRVADLPGPRFAPGAAAGADGRIYAIGGCWAGDSVVAYEPGQDRWTRAAGLTPFRRGVVAVAAAGRVYAIGGDSERQLALPTVEALTVAPS